MKSLKTRIGGALLSLAILLGVGAATTLTTQAQWQDDRYRSQREWEREQKKRQKEWRKEQRRRERERARTARDGYYRNDPYYNDRDYRNDPYYRNDRNDPYYSNSGNYSRDNYPRLGGSERFRQTALHAGYNEGIKEGREDRRRGRYVDFRNNDEYREADKDYSSNLGGDRETYRRYFRMAYETGYRDGYNGY